MRVTEVANMTIGERIGWPGYQAVAAKKSESKARKQERAKACYCPKKTGMAWSCGSNKAKAGKDPGHPVPSRQG